MATFTEFEQNVIGKIKDAILLNKEKDELGNVNLEQAIDLLRGAGAILLDVRVPSKVKGENAEEAGIPDSYYIPYPEFTNYLDILPNDKTTPIIVGCLKGLFASRVKAYLEVLGYENVYVFTGNLEDWIAVHKKTHQ